MKRKKFFLVLILLSLLPCFIQAHELGDVNSDGEIDIIDALLTAQYYVDLNPVPFFSEAADVTGCNGNIDIIDALIIAQHYVGLITSFPCDNIIIEYTRSGGITGITETVIIRIADQLIMVNDETRRLFDVEIDELMKKLDNIDVSNFPHDTEPCCCDRFSHKITLSSGIPSLNGKGEWTDCTEDRQLVPQEFLNLAALIRELADPPQVTIVMSDLSRNIDPQPDSGELDSVVSGNNLFAFDCFQRIKSEDENIFFSPVSFSFAFAMCYAGANGDTETEIAHVMHFTLPEENLHNAFNAFELALTHKPENPPPETGEEFELYIANSTWGQRDYYYVPDFLDILAYHYDAGMNIVDFIYYPESCRLLINNWVSEQTEERINDLLPPDSINSLTRLVLTNVIYFKANWLYPFDESDTKEGPFTLLDGTTATVPLMYQKIKTPYYEVPGEYSAVQLPYQGVKNNSMIIILPDQGQFKAFENSFSNQKLRIIVQAMTDHSIELTMPKFRYEWGADYPFNDLLINLGMRDAFSGGKADFSGINGRRNLFITDVFHKGFIAVDELGTEAAAATAIVIGKSSFPAMTIDRPFIFVIRNDDTGAILFFGRVLEP